MEKLKKVSLDVLLEMIREINNWDGYYNGYMISEMDEIDELLYGMELSTFIECIKGRTFNSGDKYLILNNEIGYIYSISNDNELINELAYMEDEIIDYYNSLVEQGSI